MIACDSIMRVSCYLSAELHHRINYCCFCWRTADCSLHSFKLPVAAPAGKWDLHGTFGWFTHPMDLVMLCIYKCVANFLLHRVRASNLGKRHLSCFFHHIYPHSCRCRRPTFTTRVLRRIHCICQPSYVKLLAPVELIYSTFKSFACQSLIIGGFCLLFANLRFFSCSKTKVWD